MKIKYLCLLLLFILSHTVLAQISPSNANDAKTSIVFENDPFANPSPVGAGILFVKFHILVKNPTVVYFQDTNKYTFHYDFARARLLPFLNMSRPQFDALSLHIKGQQDIMGTVLIPYHKREIGIQFVGLDSYPKESVATWIKLVSRSVISKPAVKALYMPEFEQTSQANLDKQWFASQGIEVATASRWIEGNIAYAEGWAQGRMVKVAAKDINAAYGAGRITYKDILLIDSVPAELPSVRGIITSTPATPNSHVAILASSQHIPFAFVSNLSEQRRINQLAGHTVFFSAAKNSVNISPVDKSLTPAVAKYLENLQIPKKVDIKPRLHFGQLSINAKLLTPKHIQFFGGKASNFGLLNRVIPQNSPAAIAFSFDLWEAYLKNVNPETNLSLGREIDSRLAQFTYPPNLAQARPKLAEVQNIIRKKIQWTPAQKAAILGRLASFNHQHNLKFRSSSNAEDTVELSGAGLYDSFSGCVLDDTDNDDLGPSRCDLNEPKEHGALKAIEKTFASFYNENAWLERLRHKVPENKVGMAILVHDSFPNEMANGVATLSYQVKGNAKNTTKIYDIHLVSQVGETSITNPSGTAGPEQMNAFVENNSTDLAMVKASDLVPLGGTVMIFETDYKALIKLLTKVTDGYARIFPAKKQFTLDMEYKKIKPNKLILKQVREIIEPGSQLAAPVILNEPLEWAVFQGEFGDAWAYHRLKSSLTLNTRNFFGTQAGFSTPPLVSSSFSFYDNGNVIKQIQGSTNWPQAQYKLLTDGFLNTWHYGIGKNQRKFELFTHLPEQRVNIKKSPAMTQIKFTQELKVTYGKPVPVVDIDGNVTTRLSEQATLFPRRLLTKSMGSIQTRIMHVGKATVTTRFRWWTPEELMVLKTAPLAAWVDTRIAGLTKEPIVLHNEASQTYAPSHHNFFETFIFEPRLDPKLSNNQRNELQKQNVMSFSINHNQTGFNNTPNSFKVLGLDGRFRDIF